MNKRRLLKLAEFLETAEIDGEFNMATWGQRNECGTSACALGWATMIPAFKRAGLYGEWKHLPGEEIAMLGIGLRGAATPKTHPLRIAERFFDISDREASFLFIPDTGREFGKRGRRIVAKRIRKLVASTP